ncbi:hypothetical protein D3C84_1062800 [compost metagenome]
MLFRDAAAVELTDRCFEEHFNRERELGDAAESLLLECWQVVVRIRLAAGFQRLTYAVLVLLSHVQ